MCLSHISFTVHPAPLITNAPAPNRASNVKSGTPPDATVRPQVDGQNKSHVPADKSSYFPIYSIYSRKYAMTYM